MAENENSKRVLVGLKGDVNILLNDALKIISKVRYNYKNQFVDTAVLKLMKSELLEVKQGLGVKEEKLKTKIQNMIDDINEMLR